MSKDRTIYACGACASTSLLREAAVGINDPGEVHEYDSVTCPNCGYDGTHHFSVEVPRDLDIEDIVDENHTLLPEWKAKAFFILRERVRAEAGLPVASYDQHPTLAEKLVDRLPLVEALFWFIENVDNDTEGRSAAFFILRERARAEAGLHASADSLRDALYAALPFVEDAEDDEGYKKGYVKSVLTKIRNALSSAG